jgi:hypothetical protein
MIRFNKINNINFIPPLISITKIKPFSIVVADIAIDNKDNNHIIVKKLTNFSTVSTRYENLYI